MYKQISTKQLTKSFSLGNYRNVELLSSIESGY